jgi:hypothetical protein
MHAPLCGQPGKSSKTRRRNDLYMALEPTQIE